MESYMIRFIAKGYNWPAQEMVVPKEGAIKMLADESLLLLLESTEILPASPWKIDTNCFLCSAPQELTQIAFFAVQEIAFFTGEKSGKAGKSAPRPSFSGESTGKWGMVRKVDCAVQHITIGRDE